VFSGDGLSALANFEYHKSGVFWIGIISTGLWLCGLIYGYYSDYIHLKDIEIKNHLII